MRKEINVTVKDLIEMDNNANEMEITANKAKVAILDVIEYFSETSEDYLKLYADTNEIKANMVLDYVLELQKEIDRLQKQIIVVYPQQEVKNEQQCV